MTQRTLEKWSGAAFMLTGILTIIFWFVHPDRTLTSLAAKASPAWTTVNVMFVVLIISNIFGLFGWYSRNYSRAGVLGFLATFFGTIGLTLFTAAGAIDAFVTPILARTAGAQSLLDATSPLTKSLTPVFTIGGFAFLLGFVLLGVAMLRLKSSPRWLGVLFIISSPVLGLSPLMPPTVRLVFSVLFGIAALFAGLSLWKEEARA